MRRCSRSDHSTRAYVAEYVKLLVGQVRLCGGQAKWRALSVHLRSLYLLICAINRQLIEMEGEDALNVLNKPDKRQVKCYVFWMHCVNGISVQKIKLVPKLYHFIRTGSRRSILDAEMECGIVQKCKIATHFSLYVILFFLYQASDWLLNFAQISMACVY